MLGYLPIEVIGAGAQLWAKVRDKRPVVARQPLPFVAKQYKR
jgi:hypothetical protein